MFAVFCAMIVTYAGGTASDVPHGLVACCKGLGLDEKYVHELEFESMFILGAVGNQP